MHRCHPGSLARHLACVHTDRSRARHGRTCGSVAIVLRPHPCAASTLMSLGRKPGRARSIGQRSRGVVVAPCGRPSPPFGATPSRKAANSRKRLPRHDGTLTTHTPPGESDPVQLRRAVASGSSRCSSTLLQMMASMLASATSSEHVGKPAAEQRAVLGRPALGRRRRRRAAVTRRPSNSGNAERGVVATADVGGADGRDSRRGSDASARSTASARGGRRRTAARPGRTRSCATSRVGPAARSRSPRRG